jgi:hypothetical protein
MSAWLGQQRARLPRFADEAVERARLTVVPRQRRRAPRVPFMILVSMVLLGGVVGLLMFNTHMQQVSFRATDLEARADALHAEEQSLRMDLDTLRDPQRVAQRAQRLGMVPMANPAFLRLSDGEVLGNPAPAAATDRQRLTPLPPPKPRDFIKRPVIVEADPAGPAGSGASDGSGASGEPALPADPPDSGAVGVPSDVPAGAAGTTD